ncbi:23S rRNA (uracil(1939)-C(5))-methyltransferase RlmD [Tenuibacillus multivorans]|uniref:23S rRNA (Uracil1939-C5)-methyltransferase n=1 Tax=Tenuibacillus multivorans TaxID=237069 RepID=A0A1H0EAA0_9BACI|nr:23S rRNA (uracil(1939)-C(5))-methyltransferase RlmD [Tenuibacillus multivorans]GEL78730.1 23S rRNA (uracil-C(5))-methyltransferase RlmCD [Tenuibacillus multivorans]SDN79322.1 23S rRNA (uracil1939-C5)-methyltransferase [Tenuibacillus multivorans]
MTRDHQNEKEQYRATIEGLDRRGSGQAVVWRENELGNPKKLKLVVPRSLPGEQVKVDVDYPTKKWSKAHIQEIIDVNPERTIAPCPHFDICGGCVWQHWDYSGQLKHKTEHVKKAITEQGFDPDLVKDAIGMDRPWDYRNKMEFTFSPEGAMGLHEQGNFRNVFDLETCLIAGDDMVDAALEVSRWAKDHQLKGYEKEQHVGLLRHLMVRQSFSTGEIMLAVIATEPPAGELAEMVDDLVQRIEGKNAKVKSLLWIKNTLWADRVQAEEVHTLFGRDFIYDEIAGYRYRLWFDTFFQTNPTQAEKLVELALEVGNPKPTETMIDLFCGVGTFSLPFANQVKELAGVEIVESSIESAKRNAVENGLNNTFFLASDARRGIDQVLEKFGQPDLLLLDPPRSGAGGKVMRRIGRSKPKRIVYVSCNPVSFAEDIAELKQFNYELISVQPVDLFPHTVHVELVSEIVLNEGAEF